MSKHTPGPWEAIDWCDKYPEDEDNHKRGEYFFIERGTGGTNLSQWMSEADARLIAAAPDLLASILNSDDAHWTPAMRAAVAKATGVDRLLEEHGT